MKITGLRSLDSVSGSSYYGQLMEKIQVGSSEFLSGKDSMLIDPFEEVDEAYKKAVENGATPVLEPEFEPWGQRTCYIADPEGNLIEIGSWNKPYEAEKK